MNPVYTAQEFASHSAADVVAEQLSTPGYSWCLSQGIEFKQRIGSETGITYWYAEAPHYYNKPGHQYKTTCFEKLVHAVKAAVDYLGKCGTDVADVKQQMIDHLRTNLNAESTTGAVVEAVQNPTVQSGSLTFKRVLSASPTKKGTFWGEDSPQKLPPVYEVFRGMDSLGIIVRDKEGLWANSCGSDCTNNYATPYEAAAAFVKPNLPNLPNIPTTVAAVPEIEIDSDIDTDFGVLYRVWNSCTLLGTFYHAANGKWVAQPCDSDDRPRCNTAAEAQLIIVVMSGLLVADKADKVVDLLDKPVDELTYSEWLAIKLAAQQAEMVAA